MSNKKEHSEQTEEETKGDSLANLMQSLSISQAKILVLMDIGDLLVVRDHLDNRKIFGVKADFKIRKQLHYRRPGYLEFIDRVFNHPRANVAFYTSMFKRNAEPILDHLLTHIGKNSSDVFIFDSEFCSPMLAHPKYKMIKQNDWDTYRDLEKVFKEFNDFSRVDTLIIDSDCEKVQLCIENALVVEPYRIYDVMQKSGGADTYRTKTQQECYMKEVTDQVIQILERAGSDIRESLKSGLKEKFRAKRLLGD